MKTLSEIKDEFANEHGYKDFYTMQFPHDMVCEEDINAIAKRYAEEALKEAAERATIKSISNPDYHPGIGGLHMIDVVDKESILSLIKELK